jgi:hypothetical protein
LLRDIGSVCVLLALAALTACHTPARARVSVPIGSSDIGSSDDQVLRRLEKFVTLTALRAALGGPQVKQAGGVISNGGAGVLSNAGGAVLSSNGANVVSNGGARFAAAPSPLTPGRTYRSLSGADDAEDFFAPKAGEAVYLRRLYPDRTRLVTFTTGDNEELGGSRTVLEAGTGVLQEIEGRGLALHPPTPIGRPVAKKRSRVRTFEKGRVIFDHVQVAYYDPEQRMYRNEVESGTAYDQSLGASVELGAVVVDIVQRVASYVVRFPSMGLVEEGSGEPLQLEMPLYEPLVGIRGQAVVRDATGAVLFRKRSDAEGIWYELGEGLQIRLTGERAGGLQGDLLQNGVKVGLVTVNLADARPGTLGIAIELAGGIYDAVARKGRVAFVPQQPKDAPSPPSDQAGGGVGRPAESSWFVRTLAVLPGARLSNPRLIAGPREELCVVALDSAGPSVLVLAPDWTVRLAVGERRPSYPVERFIARDIGQPIRLFSTLSGLGVVVTADKGGFSELRGFGTPSGDNFSVVFDAAGVLDVDEGALESRRIVGTDVPGHADGESGQARFNEPRSIVRMADGSYVVADFKNHVLRRITEGGQVGTLAGQPGVAGEQDGVGPEARFNFPAALDLLPDGDMVVADSGNRRLCRVSADGRVSTLAGGRDTPWQDGPSPGFGLIDEMQVGPSGRIYLTEVGLGGSVPEAIRRVEPSGSSAVTLAGGFKRGSADGFAPAAGLQGLRDMLVLESKEDPDDPLVIFTDGAQVRSVKPMPSAP